MNINNHTDFNSLFNLCDINFENISNYEEVYFFGDISNSFASRARQIALHLHIFSGVVVFSMSDEKKTRITNRLRIDRSFSFVTIENIPKNKKVLIIDFNDDLLGKAICQKIKTENIHVMDFIYALSELNLAHTYVSVKEERNKIISELPNFRKIYDALTDKLSKETLVARIQSYLILDRSPLLFVKIPGQMNFNSHGDFRGSLCLRSDEIYVDAGAAHGDTVSQFYDLTQGNYKEIYAFEPDVINYNSLGRLCQYIPNVYTFHAGLGDMNQTMHFNENPDNRLGSNFMNSSVPSEAEDVGVEIFRLDDITQRSTLIKIDVEGYESKVIVGAKENIKNNKPNLSISGYHYPEDLIQIFNSVEDCHHYEHIALRHYGSSLYDTNYLYSDIQAFE